MAETKEIKVGPGRKYQTQDQKDLQRIRSTAGGARNREIKIQQNRIHRDADIERGRERGTMELGRLDPGRSSSMDRILQRVDNQSQGLSNPEYTAARESRMRNLQRMQEGQRRQLAGQMGGAGMRGPAAAGQFGNLLGQQNRQNLQAEQELMMKDIDLQRSGLDRLFAGTRAAETDELGKEKFNLGQGQREQLARMGSGLAEAQIGSAERIGMDQADVGQALASAYRNMGGGGKK